MVNEEKSRELIGCNDWCESINKCNYKKTNINCYAYGIAMKMAEWKDQQAIEYLYKNIQSLLKDYGVSEASADISTQLFLANFKKAMEE